MATLIQGTGFPGSGKSFGIKSAAERYPNQIFLINPDGKSLPWKGWRKHFSKENKNYSTQLDMQKIVHDLKYISNKMPHIKVVFVDTINRLMNEKERQDMKRPGFDKWADMAAYVYDLYAEAHKLRDDLIVVFLAHSELYETNDGEILIRTKTNGRKLNKWSLNSMLSYNLYTEVEGSGKDREYFFITQSDGRTEARSPEGVLEEKMPNDWGEVIHRVRTLDLGLEDEATVVPMGTATQAA